MTCLAIFSNLRVYQQTRIRPIRLFSTDRVVTADDKFIFRDSLVVEHKGKDYYIYCTDGSYDNSKPERTAWAAFLVTKERKMRAINATKNSLKSIQRAGVVEGPKHNNRAELMAILGALLLTDEAHLVEKRRNIFFGTDSQYSIDQISSWKGKKISAQRKIADRDLIRAIVARMDQLMEMDITVTLVHVPSHLDDPATAERKSLLVQRCIAACGQDIFKHLKYGNSVADNLAKGMASGQNHPVKRDFAKHPTPHLDDFYATTGDGSLLNTSIHKHIKRRGSKRNSESLSLKKGSRAAVHQLVLKEADPKRSFRLLPGDYKYQKAQDNLRKLRYHAIFHEKKGHSFGRQRAPKVPSASYDPTVAMYYNALYPTSLCQFCDEKGIQAVSDTDHVMSCPSRPSSTAAFTQLSTDIYALIDNSKSPNGRRLSNALLHPFWSRLQNERDVHTLAFSSMADKASIPFLAQVHGFSWKAGQYGLIPPNLDKALMELDVLKAKSAEVADSISVLIHHAIADDYRLRCRELAQMLGQKDAFRTIRLGLPSLAGNNAQQAPQSPVSFDGS